jgi:16S rRNA (guanine527-N7)-methyltransferase
MVGPVLERSRSLGFLGPGPVAAHLDHAVAMVEACGTGQTARALDLGSGGGLPGLVLAALRPEWSIVLLDAHQRRTSFLRESIAELGWSNVDVVTMRAEEAGRSDLRGRFDVVASRSFGPPAVTAECASPLLVVGGRLIVSEPPQGTPAERWPVDGLTVLGLEPVPAGQDPEYDAAIQVVVFEQRAPCPERFPRRTGVPGKRPLWSVPRET